MNKWTRNQKLLLLGLVIVVIFNSIQVFQMSERQGNINIDLDEIKGKIGEFEVLTAQNAILTNITFANNGSITDAKIWYNGSGLIIGVN